MPAAPQASPMTPKSTNGATWSRTSSKKSKSSVVSPPDTTKPTPASEPLSISSQPSWPSSECRQTLVLQRRPPEHDVFIDVQRRQAAGVHEEDLGVGLEIALARQANEA